MAELGDLSGFLGEGSDYPLLTKEANLDWLSVSEADYRAQEILPQQNFEVMPELEKAWAEGRSSTLVPVKDYHPAKVMTAPVVIRPEAVAKTARFALMAGQPVVETLLRTYDKVTLRSARDLIASVMGEKGLCGPYYVLASDFEIVPGKYDYNLIRRYATDTKYVVGKIACGCGCGGACNPFEKPEVSDLSEVYTASHAARVEVEEAAAGKQVTASANLPPRDRIRNAYLATKKVATDSPKPILNPVQFLAAPKKVAKVHLPMIAQERSRLASLEAQGGPTIEKTAFEVKELLKREILKGSSQPQLLTALKVAFSKQALRDTRDSWEPLFKEAGILGTVYSFQEAFDFCKEGADFLDQHNSPVTTIVAGLKCDGCPSNRLGHCTEYNRPLSASVEETLTPDVIAKVARSKFASIPQGDARTQLRSLYLGTAPSAPRLQAAHPQAYIAPKTASVKIAKSALVLTAERHLAKGLSGPRLLKALQKQFDPRVIAASVEELRSVIASFGKVEPRAKVAAAPDFGREMVAEFEMGSRQFDFDLGEEKTAAAPLEIDLERKY